jgi:trafficking protein particle complex subunit 1
LAHSRAFAKEQARCPTTGRCGGRRHVRLGRRSRSPPLSRPAATPAATPAASAAMAVYSFYLFDRTGACLCYREWARTLRVNKPEDDQKNMFGMLFALREFTVELSPSRSKAAGTPRHFATDAYALHYFETPTGLRFVLTTSKDFGAVDLARHLREIYSEVYVEFVVKNPLAHRADQIRSPLFLAKLDSYIRALPCF